MKLQLEVEEETTRENYWDLIELVMYRGLCMTRHVAEERGRGQRQRESEL